MDRADGYLKVDSPGSMFVQVKWSDPDAQNRNTIFDLAARATQFFKKNADAPKKLYKTPELRNTLEAFLKQTSKQAKKGKIAFESKIKPETKEAGGERTALHFSWTGGGSGQGKIWHCQSCNRVVIAQVVGQGRDNIADVAAQLFASLRDHGQGGWEVWALYDLVAGIPDTFSLKEQKLMSGYLRLDFERFGGERIRIERWGLASISRKKFTLAEWFHEACDLGRQKANDSVEVIQGHSSVEAKGRLRGIIAWTKALRDAAFTFRPATRYEGACWECPETNKIYAVQVWHNARTEGLLEELTERCECH